MDLTVLIPDKTFEKAEELRAKLNLTRDELYARALDEFWTRYGLTDDASDEPRSGV